MFVSLLPILTEKYINLMTVYSVILILGLIIYEYSIQL